jgi:hypothetical protein
MAVDTQHVVDDVLGTSGDAAVLSYICSCLADEDFDYDETYDVFGDMLVRLVVHFFHSFPAAKLPAVKASHHWTKAYHGFTSVHSPARCEKQAVVRSKPCA